MFENFTGDIFYIEPCWLSSPLTLCWKVESQRRSRLENYKEAPWPRTVFRDPVAPQCQRFSDTCSSAAFQKQEGGGRENCCFPSAKIFRQLKTLVLSFLTCPNFNFPLFEHTRVEHLLCIKPPCLLVKLTFCREAGVSLSDSWMIHMRSRTLGRGAGAVVVFRWLWGSCTIYQRTPETW